MFLDNIELILFNSLYILFCFLVAFSFGSLLKLSKKDISTFFICLGFGNVAYLGMPIITRLLGVGVLPTVGLLVGIYSFWMFTVGVGFLEFNKNKQKSLKKTVKVIGLHLIENPLLISVFLGLLFSLINLRVPELVMASIDMISASVTPIVLVIIGLFIGRGKLFCREGLLSVLVFCFLTLILMPGLYYLFLSNYTLPKLVYSPSLLEAAMPLAITPFALADKFDLNKKFIAKSIVFSTIFSMFTLPLWVSFLS